jgi:ATP-dependent protease HslVU (ClpYQ) peptidase subunit
MLSPSMTCIAALVDAGDVYIGGDSASVAGHTIAVRSDGKVFRSGEYLIGFGTSFRMGQLLQHRLRLPEPPSGGELHTFMVRDFADAVRACLKEGGFAGEEDGSERGGHFLVGVRGRLFHVGGDYQVAEYASGFAAIGSGEDFALGSLHSTAGQPPLQRVLTALEAAERFAWAVRRPFLIGTTASDEIAVYAGADRAVKTPMTRAPSSEPMYAANASAVMKKLAG